MRKRLVSAFILLLVYAPIIVIGGNLFKVGITLTAILCYREFFHLIKKDNNIPIAIEILSYILTGAIVLSNEYIIQAIAATFILMFIPLILYKTKEYSYDAASKMTLSTLMIGFAFYVLNTVRMESLHVCIYLILITIFTDTFAFLGGKFLGKHKLIPRVSPNKTIEGTLCGFIIGSLVPTVYYVTMVDQSEGFFDILIVSMIYCIFAVIGDLVFSATKRRFEIKDFSNTIPGVGGLLDLFDSLIFTCITYSIVSILL